MRLPLLALLAALAAAGPALAVPDNETRSVEPGNFYERNLDLTQGEVVAWSFAIAPPGHYLEYDIHTHLRNGSVVYYADNVTQTSASGVFTVPSTGLYSWLGESVAGYDVVQITIVTDVQAAKATPGAPALPGALAALGAAFALTGSFRSRGTRSSARGPRRAPKARR